MPFWWSESQQAPVFHVRSTRCNFSDIGSNSSLEVTNGGIEESLCLDGVDGDVDILHILCKSCLTVYILSWFIIAVYQNLTLYILHG